MNSANHAGWQWTPELDRKLLISKGIARPAREFTLEDLVENKDHHRSHDQHHADYKYSRTMKKTDEFTEQPEYVHEVHGDSFNIARQSSVAVQNRLSTLIYAGFPTEAPSGQKAL